MIRAFDALSLPVLRWLDPEDAHRLAIQGLRCVVERRPGESTTLRTPAGALRLIDLTLTISAAKEA